MGGYRLQQLVSQDTHVSATIIPAESGYADRRLAIIEKMNDKVHGAPPAPFLPCPLLCLGMEGMSDAGSPGNAGVVWVDHMGVWDSRHATTIDRWILAFTPALALTLNPADINIARGVV